MAGAAITKFTKEHHDNSQAAGSFSMLQRSSRRRCVHEIQQAKV